MSEYAGVTPIPDYLNISDWYELVDGDSIPNKWSSVKLYPDGVAASWPESYGQPASVVRAALKNGIRLFTRTPPPSAIKRIRAAETQQDELPPAVSDLEVLQRRMNDLEVQFTDLYSELSKLNERLNNYIDGA